MDAKPSIGALLANALIAAGAPIGVGLFPRMHRPQRVSHRRCPCRPQHSGLGQACEHRRMGLDLTLIVKAPQHDRFEVMLLSATSPLLVALSQIELTNGTMLH